MLRYLYDISGKHTLTGQVEHDNHKGSGTTTGVRSDWDVVENITGHFPAIYGNQFLWGTEEFTRPVRQAWVDRAAELWRGDGDHGQAITHVNFHLCPPQARFADHGCTWNDIEGNPPNASLVDALLTKGTEEQRIWFEEVDTMGGYLLQLQEQGVPVLWRPFHEMNGCWFWWGCTSRLEELWGQLYDRMTGHLDVHNLLWVWGASSQETNLGPLARYYPGHNVVDALGLDTYVENDLGYSSQVYDHLITLAEGRPIGLAEVGHAPTVGKLRDDQNLYAWFLMWGDYEKSKNTAAELSALYDDAWFLTQGQIEIGTAVTIV